MIQGSEQQEEQHVAARDNRSVSIQQEDGDYDKTTFTMSSPSPSKDSLRDDPEITRLALPFAGPVGEDPDDDEEENAKEQTAKAKNSAVNVMDGDDTDIKKMTRKGWKLCTVLTCFALVLIATAVYVTVVHGATEGKPNASQQDDSEDVSSP
jgi:hypothetical protein